jgi:hypothetical protein
VAKIEQVTGDFRSLLITSLAIATVSFGLPFLRPPGAADLAIRFSLLLALVWIALIVFAFVKYRTRALWCLFGLPFISYWFVVLSSIATACAQSSDSGPYTESGLHPVRNLLGWYLEHGHHRPREGDQGHEHRARNCRRGSPHEGIDIRGPL